MEKKVERLAGEWFEAHRAEIARFASLRNRRRNRTEKEEAEAECMAYAWQWTLRAASLNKLDRINPRMISLFAYRLYCAGRRFAGGKKWRNDLNLDAVVVRVENDSTRTSALVDSLASHRFADPAEMARIEVDYTVAASAMTKRQREVLAGLVYDHERGSHERIAQKLNLSQPRITQLKAKIAERLTEIGYGPLKR